MRTARFQERELSGGLGLDKESFFPNRPENPEMRESTSIWLFEENGAFAFPRIGIEGEAWFADQTAERAYAEHISRPLLAVRSVPRRQGFRFHRVPAGRVMKPNFTI